MVFHVLSRLAKLRCMLPHHALTCCDNMVQKASWTWRTIGGFGRLTHAWTGEVQRVWTKLPLDEPFQPHHCSKERPRAASPHPPWSQVKQRQGRSAYCLHLLQVLSTWWSPRMKSNQTHTRNLGSFPLLVGQKKCTEVRRLLRHVLSACPPKWQWWHKAELPGYRRWPVRTRWRWVGRRARAPGSSQVLLGFPSGTWKPGNGPAGNVPSWWEYFPCCKHWTVTSPARAVWRGGHCGS